MGKFVELKNKGIVKYEAITQKPFDQIFNLERILKFYKFQAVGSVRASETFYDTPNDLLAKAGLTISKIQEADRVFFKVCQKGKHAATKQKVYSHRVGPKDKLQDHAFYLVDGIRGVFSSPFYVDLEHVVNNAIPKVSITTNANLYKVISGTGFRSYIAMEEILYNNFETKRQDRAEGLTVKLAGPEQYMPEFKSFNAKLSKYCKNFTEVDDDIYDRARALTKVIDNKKAKKDSKSAKQKLAEFNAEKREEVKEAKEEIRDAKEKAKEKAKEEKLKAKKEG